MMRPSFSHPLASPWEKLLDQPLAELTRRLGEDMLAERRPTKRTDPRMFLYAAVMRTAVSFLWWRTHDGVARLLHVEAPPSLVPIAQAADIALELLPAFRDCAAPEAVLSLPHEPEAVAVDSNEVVAAAVAKFVLAHLRQPHIVASATGLQDVESALADLGARPRLPVPDGIPYGAEAVMRLADVVSASARYKVKLAFTSVSDGPDDPPSGASNVIRFPRPNRAR